MIRSRRALMVFAAAVGSIIWAGNTTINSAWASDPETSSALTLSARHRVQEQPGSEQYEVREKGLRWEAEKTAIIICDMWNRHWCQSASRRVGQMASTMNQVVAGARAKGVLVIHAPSGCMDYYNDAPGRKLAQEAPPAESAPEDIHKWCRKLAGEPDLPVDDSDGGCDCQPKCESHKAWSRQIDAIQVADGDAISDSGREIWNMLEHRGIDNVILMGVHTNMCVSGRPFGLRQMARGGKNVVLVRDLTDSMYNPRRAPYVSHRRGTELVVQHIEKHICSTILANDIIADPSEPHVVFVIGEREYQTKQTLPAFAKAELEPRGIRLTFVYAHPNHPNYFPGIEAVKEADLVVLSVRRRTPPKEQLALIREYLASGKPLVGIRTASHAFALRGDKEPPPGHALWNSFDPEVLGGSYKGHHGRGGETDVALAPHAANHPILSGVETPFRSGGSLYKVRPLAEGTQALLMGTFRDQLAEPVAWTNTYNGGRIFYTSLGHPDDFKQPSFRQLLLGAVFWAMEKPVPGSAKAKAAAATP